MSQLNRDQAFHHPSMNKKRVSCLLFLLSGFTLSALDVSEFSTSEDVVIECVVSEPLVIDPVAMAFDEHQRMWVAENRAYPSVAPDVRQGQIALLEDTNLDGCYEKRTTFATGLSYPNGVIPWEGGVIVTDAPNILFMKDTDGDGKSDVRQTLLTGFDTSRSTQLRVNDPTLGPGGWIYLAGGLSGGRVKAPWQSNDSIIDMRRHDIRFHPYTWQLKATTGKSQYGLDIDRKGNRFICMNRVQVQHVMAEESDWGNHPFFPFSQTVENLPKERVDDLLRGYNAGARIFPLTQHETTADSHAGTFTAACAVTIYESNGLPEKYYGHVFSCDPTGNLIHFDYLEPKGPGFAVKRQESETEFVASRNPWFRPVFLTTGPEGALYVCDMRRQTIEHPDYLPEEIRKRTDFENGNDMGRIYRVRAKSASALKTKAPHEQANSQSEDIRAFREATYTGNEWRIESSFRRIAENSGSKGTRLEAFSALMKAWKTVHPDYQHWLLSLLDEEQQTHRRNLLDALAEVTPEGRTAIIKTIGQQSVETNAADNAIEKWYRSTFASSTPSDETLPPMLRFRLALEMDSWNQPYRSEVLAMILARDSRWEWTRSAVIQSSKGDALLLLKELFLSLFKISDLNESESQNIPALNHAGMLVSVEKLSEIAILEGANPSDILNTVLIGRKYNHRDIVPGNRANLTLEARKHSNEQGRREADAFFLAAMLLGMHESGKLPPPDTTKVWLEWGDPASLEAWKKVKKTLSVYSADHLTEEKKSVLHRFRILSGQEDWVWKLHEAVDLNDAALLDLVIEASRSALANEILSEVFTPTIWTRLPHAARNQFLQTACSDQRHAGLVFNAIENGLLPAGMLNIHLRNQWNRVLSGGQKERLESLSGKQVSIDALASFERLKPAAKMQGTPAKGKNLFLNLCSSCHRLDQTGQALGPDLYGIRNQAKESILLHIADPNREITSGFEGVEWTTSGETFIGLLAFDNGNQIRMQLPSGINLTFQRNQGALRNLDLSLMPEGILNALTHQQVADLLAYLRGE